MMLELTFMILITVYSLPVLRSKKYIVEYFDASTITLSISSFDKLQLFLYNLDL